jgi:hypothetical protein
MRLRLRKSSTFVFVLLSFVFISNGPTVLANQNSKACNKVKSSVKKIDNKNFATWRKFDSRRDSMATGNFSNAEYKKTLGLLKSVYQSDLNIFSIALRNSSCYKTEQIQSFSQQYDNTIQLLAEVNKVISTSNLNSESKFNSMKETIWLWIAGEYMNYYLIE